MRVCLLCNEVAGDGVSRGDVLAALRRAGHDVVQTIEHPSLLRARPCHTADVVVVAGGDGTVSRAASALAGGTVPFAILPLGTANNVARSLGITGHGTAPLDRLERAQRVSIDLGIVSSASECASFIEAVGFGLVPHGMARTDAGDRKGHAGGRLRDALRAFRHACVTAPARRCVVVLDGVAIEREVLLLEILNTSHVGPRLELSGEASPTDGRFAVVLAGPSHREHIARWLRDREAGLRTCLELPGFSATRVEILGWDECHVDGWIRRPGASAVLEVRLAPKAVDVLV